MTDIPDDKLLALLHEDERFPKIIRDDEFWERLELLAPEQQHDAVRDRFMRALPDGETPLMIELWAAQGACVAELVRRLGPLQARQQLQPTKH